MRLVEPSERNADFNCPHCGAPLKVDDSDDFMDSYKPEPMVREEDFYAECPSCEHGFKFHVTWEPTYPYDPVEVDE